MFWGLQFAAFTLDRWLRDPSGESWALLEGRAIVTLLGIFITLVILRILQRGSGKPFVIRALVALGLALLGAAVHSLLNWAVFAALVGPPPEPLWPDGLQPFLSLLYLFCVVYLAVTVVLLSLTYGGELAERERHIAELSRGPAPGQDRASLFAREAEPVQLWVRKGEQRVRLDAHEIDWVAAEGEYVRFHCGGESFLERQTLGRAEARLAPAGFIRVHRSALVNPARVERIGRTRWGALELHLRGGARVRVSKSFQSAVRRLLGGAAQPATAAPAR